MSAEEEMGAYAATSTLAAGAACAAPAMHTGNTYSVYKNLESTSSSEGGERPLSPALQVPSSRSPVVILKEPLATAAMAEVEAVEKLDDSSSESPSPARRHRYRHSAAVGDKDTAPTFGEQEVNRTEGTRTLSWLSLGKQAAESKCRELENELAEARQEVAKRETSLRVAHEKIRHLEAESKGLLEAAEFREKEASCMQEGSNLAQERAHAHEKALASALEQLSDSGVSQSRKLAELANVTEELVRTKAALERVERLVFEQRQEADERQLDEDRWRVEAETLREKLRRVERKNTELLAKQAAGRLAKKMRGNFGRSSTFCASLCSCFRGGPTYRRVASPGPLAAPPDSSSNPWLG